jgi:hypothetical protein
MFQNVELARGAYTLFNADGLKALVEHVVAPDIVFYDLPKVPDTGIFRGTQEAAARFRAIMEPFSHVHYEVRSVEGCRDYTLTTLVFGTTGLSSGVSLTVPQFRVSRWANGRMGELRVYLDADQARREYERLSTDRARSDPQIR